ncbi:MAG TPA: ATP-dependent DNA helicase [Actinomycetes bacterium]|nr:ATP-dependent DNA helicase [Actinomycetes bacterium]
MDLDAAFASLRGLAPRAVQQDMARAVAAALDERAPLLVHAPTGVGKSLGYLVPVVAAGRRAIVATATKALQAQLVERDLPRLADAFGTTSALLMGRGNYLCLSRADGLVAATRLAATAQEEAALELVDWALESETGSRLDAPPGVRDDVWDLVSTSGEDCPGQKGCAFHQRCFAERARERARDVDVVVTNHHLLLLELELRQLSDAPGVMLPEADVVVVDEAHRLAAHAADLYGVSVTATRVSRAGAAADAVAKAAGVRSDWARRLRASWERHAGELRPGAVVPGSRAWLGLGRALAPVLREAEEARSSLKDLSGLDEELQGGLHAARRRLHGLCRDLTRLMEPEPGPGRDDGDPDAEPGDGSTGKPGDGQAGRDGRVRSGAGDQGGPRDEPARELAVWVEERRDGGRAIRSALVEPGPVLQAVLWARVPATVACSATLAVAGSLDAARAALGVADAAGLVAESPFDFRRNALLYVPGSVPAPSSDRFQAAAEQELRGLVESSSGRALVLCTSWRAVESFAAALADLPYELLVQGDDTPARLAARFRDEVASVLVATRTFFEGVDVPGPSLSLLVLDRLPFPRPDDPLLSERGRRVERQGGSRFSAVWLPEAVVSLQQALGRLVRSESDRGVMAVLDRRLADAAYGATLLASLPPAPLTRSPADVRAFFAAGAGR